MKDKILLIGSGGHCKSIIDCIHRGNEYEIVGIVDQPKNKHKVLMGEEVIGNDDDLIELYKKGIKKCFVTIGSVGDFSLRKKLFELVEEIGFEIVNIIDPSAIVSETTHLGKGIFIGKGAIVNSDVIVYDYAIINTRSLIEHDCIIGKYVHIAPGAVIAGNVNIGTGSHIGANSTVIQNIKIGEHCLIGAGSTVIRDVTKHQKVWGIVNGK